MSEEQPSGVRIPIEWHSSAAKVKNRYANNMVVQHTDTEFIISFFEVSPPVILGSPQQQVDQLKSIGTVQAECVARIVVSPKKMKGFIDALQRNLDSFHSEFDKEEEQDD